MSIDLNKLTAAPWGVVELSDQFFCQTNHKYAISGGLTGRIGKVEGFGEESGTNAAFIALARAAFDVMMRRRWFPRFGGRFEGVDRWCAYSWVGMKDVSDIYQDLRSTVQIMPEWFADPFTALVSADEWMKTQEKNDHDA